ncbi:MAG: hypothetical protein JO156_07105 [Solirubrobacterales bacterium]|nr:hypothetical protein [Solirubrobacterales bacterium]
MSRDRTPTPVTEPELPALSARPRRPRWQPQDGAVPAEVIARIDSEVHHIQEDLISARNDQRTMSETIAKLEKTTAAARAIVALLAAAVSLSVPLTIAGTRWAMRATVTEMFVEHHLLKDFAP